MRVPHGQERVSLWESWVGHCLHRLCLIPRPIPPPLAGPCWLPLGPHEMQHDPSFWNGSNKLFLNGNGLQTCWPDHTWVIIKCAFLKQVLVLRVTHLPGLWHLTLVPHRATYSSPDRFNHGDTLLFQYYVIYWPNSFRKLHSDPQHICNRKEEGWLVHKSYLIITLGIILTYGTKSPCILV